MARISDPPGLSTPLATSRSRASHRWSPAADFDPRVRRGSYDGIWIVGILLGIFAALVHLPIVERPVPRLLAAAAAR